MAASTLPSRRGAAPAFGRVGAQTFVFNGLGLLVNLVSGVIVARTIGTSGRGGLTAITTIALVGTWVFGMGCIPAVSFHAARHPHDAARLLTTWLVMIVPIAVLAIGVTELLCPLLLGAQPHSTVILARLYLLSLLPSLIYQVAYGVLLGDHDFLFVNVSGFLRFAAITAGYGAIVIIGHLSLTSAIIVGASVDLTMCTAFMCRAIRRHGWARPDIALGRKTLWYGFRAHGTQIGGVVSARVDLLMLPAFLGAASVGLYSVATNVSWIVYTLANALAAVVLPAAARHQRHRTAIMVAAIYATMIVGFLLAALLALVAGPAVHIVYGSAFGRSVSSIRLLLPGTVAYAVAGVIGAGLYALDRPGLAAIAQVPGIIITVSGLLLFLRHGGIIAASIVSSVAYISVLLASVFLYRRAAGAGWSEFTVRPHSLWRFLQISTTASGESPDMLEVSP